MLALQEVGGGGGVAAGGWDDHGIGGAFADARDMMGLPNGGVGEGFWDTLSGAINRAGDIYQQREQRKTLERTGRIIPIQPTDRQKEYAIPPGYGPITNGGGQSLGIGSLSPGIMLAGAAVLVLVLVMKR